MMDAQQSLFTGLKLKIEALGLSVYDGGMPSEDAPYPFVYLADNTMRDTMVKGYGIGTVSQNIHVWQNDAKKRGTLSRIAAEVMDVCREFEDYGGTGYTLRSLSQKIIADNSTAEPLMHAIIEAEYYYS